MPLSPSQLAELRAELERELARLHRSMPSTEQAAETVHLDQACVGRLTRMEAIASQEMARALHEREQALELRIVDALQRLDEGTYGACATCGLPIPYGRLLVMPEARTCATCGGA
ncbi:MAG: TraR/DksA family transcriptional regulator [Gemmatimonadaceae bacterium]